MVVFGTDMDSHIMSPFTTMSERQRREMEASMDDMYDLFRRVVAEDRGMSFEEVSRLAEGR
jgi:ClpP class serine protease